MRVSIAMATYNGIDYLQEQLDSFCAQTVPPDELVVSDDCSSDETVGILERFAARAPFPVNILRNRERVGYAGNFDRALRGTVGDLVFLSDQDDVWCVEKIERIVAAAAADPHAMVLMNDAALVHADLSLTGLTKLGQVEAMGLTESAFVMGCCAAVRREWLSLCTPLPHGCTAHDTWIIGLAVALGQRRIVRDVLQVYRRHGSNASQVLSNRTKPVSRWAARVHAWLWLLKKRTPVPGAWAWDEARRDWARDLLPRAPERLAEPLRRFESRMALAAERKSIRAMPWPRRVAPAVALWRRGGYARASGFRSVLRDIAGV